MASPRAATNRLRTPLRRGAGIASATVGAGDATPSRRATRHRTAAWTGILAAALGGVLGGCAAVPAPSQAARPELPEAFAPPLGSSSGNGVSQSWWSQLQDPQLDALVARALAANRDLQVATARIAEARALAAAADSRVRPQLSLGGHLTRDRQSVNGRFGPLAPNPVNERGFGLDAAWEPDPFGAIARRRDAAHAEVQATAARRGAVAVGVAGEVATTYIELRAAQMLQATLRELLDAARAAEGLVAAREQAGLASALDRLRAAEQVSLTAAALPLARQREETAVRRLGVLVGGHAQSLLASLGAPAPLPPALPPIPAAVPAELLDRRPDLLAAESRWRAARARLAAAEADRLPRFSLGGALGLLSISQGKVFDASSAAWNLSAALRAPLYAPELDAAIDAERARAERAAVAYEAAAFRAMLDVEEAAVRLHRAQEHESQLGAALAADVEALRLARIRYERGLTDFLAVLDVVRSRAQVEQQWVDARARVFIAFVALNEALGGSFDPADWDPAAADAAGGG